MAKSKIDTASLERLLFEELRKDARCTEIEEVTVKRLSSRENGANWKRLGYTPGNAPTHICRRVLDEIETRFQDMYDLED